MKQDSWKIFFYKTPQGDSPVQEFIDGLEIKTQPRVQSIINFLREFGLRAGSPHVKKLTGTPLWELRMLGVESIRILYIAIVDKTFLLLHGFKKKKNKTPLKDIQTALERLEEYRSRH